MSRVRFEFPGVLRQVRGIQRSERSQHSRGVWLGFLILSVLICVQVIACPAGWSKQSAQAATDTDVSGTITTNTTWTSVNSPYRVIGDVTVNQNVTLTIEPGVQVRFNGDYALVVLGTLYAVGTQALPITFTSNQSSPNPGDWGMIDFRSQSQTNFLKHTIIEYGGDAAKAGGGSAAMVLVNTTSLTIEQSTIRHSATRGITLFQSSASILDNTFEHNYFEGIGLQTCNLTVSECHPTITGNTFNDNKAPVLQVGPHNPVLGGNTAEGNDRDGYMFWLPCNVQGSTTFYANDLPYVVEGGWCHMGVYDRPTTIDIQPGTIFKLAGGAIKFQYTTVVTATGTLESPIIFTSLKDDTFGGDTDNQNLAPAQADWVLVQAFGSQVTAAFAHTIFRYGGSSGAWGALVASEGGAHVSVRDSEFSESRVGVYTYSPGNLEVLNSRFYDMSVFGANINTTGSVLLDGNTFAHIVYDGVRFDNGAATVIRNNLFDDVSKGVRVVCSTPPCAPVISPNNRFGGGEYAVYVDYPTNLCIDARRNWWGDVSGPIDISTAADGCGSADNPGGNGRPVTNGVRYSPWTGGMGRPILAYPRCGVTAQELPEFRGAAAAGASVTFYDGETILGQTTTGADDLFQWTPSTVLADGEYLITAITELDGETSLPSTPPLALRIDSSLPFDPMEVKMAYDLHGARITQYMRDENGCADENGSLNAPIWVRPGTSLTLTVPIRQELALLTVADGLSLRRAAPETGAQALDLSGLLDLARRTLDLPNALPGTSNGLSWLTLPSSFGDWLDDPSGPDDPDDGWIAVVNYGRTPMIGYRSAPLDGHANNRVYGEYGPFVPFIPPIGLNESRVISVGDGVQDLAVIDTNQHIAYRTDVEPGNPDRDDLVVPNAGVGEVIIENESGVQINRLWFARTDGQLRDYIGADLIEAGRPLTKTLTLHLPDGVYDVLATGPGGEHFLRVTVDSYSQTARVTIRPSNCPASIRNSSDRGARELRIFHYPYGAYQRHVTPSPAPVNLLQVLDRNTTTPEIIPGTGYSLIMEDGDYRLAPRDASGYLIGDRFYDYQVQSNPCNVPIVDIRQDCQNSSFFDLMPGTREFYELICPGAPRAPNSTFLRCTSVMDARVGQIGFRICGGDSEVNSTVAPKLIDPDGYVYYAFAGIDAKIAGATVTCDVYDQDYRTWARWPAEVYESQVNPQVTAADGYYAFFVPPGFYRVRASAPGYQAHTSPTFEVISEIVHYNIPLTNIPLFLPLVTR